MTEDSCENEPTRRQWVGFWSMICQQTQNAFNDKMAQFTLIPLAGALGFAFVLPVGGLKVDVPSAAGLMIALPFVLFAPLAGWVSDRFSKRDVMLGAAIAQVLVLALICGAVALRNIPLALCGFFALAVQSAFFSPAKFGINKELVGSKHLGFAANIQQMTAMLAILAGQILAGWLFDERYTSSGGGVEMAYKAALPPLLVLAALSIPALAMAIAIPRVPAQDCRKFTARLAVSHFINLGELWRDVPLRRAAFGVAFFWGFAAFINLWSVKLAQWMTGGGKGFGTLSSIFMAAALLGMAAGFGFGSFLLRRRIELAWVPLAGMVMTVTAIALAFMTPDGTAFLVTLGLLAFSAAMFLAPLNAWAQDRYPAAKRGELQSAVNLQDCLAGIVAVLLIGLFEFGARRLGISPGLAFRLEIGFIGLLSGAVTIGIIGLLPRDFIRLVGCGIVRSIYRIRTTGSENIPLEGGALLLPNHVTFADAFFITSACPRQVRFVMDDVFMASPWIRAFVSIFDTVTIRRDQPREAIRITIDALKNGELVCLFPEGQLTRTGTLSELRRGFELIARKADHPLVPMYCDGAWGSIFSFERGKFFAKRPYRVPYGLTMSFGREIPAGSGDLETVRDALHQCSAKALTLRFRRAGWADRIPGGRAPAVENFRNVDRDQRRRWWINGHQIGQIAALPRRLRFVVLAREFDLLELPGALPAFSEMFHAPIRRRPLFSGRVEDHWVGGDGLRDAILSAGPGGGSAFFDFGARALEHLGIPGIAHFPCLAVGRTVIAMSMPHAPKPQADSEEQPGHKPGTWGKLLPGWYLKSGPEGEIRAHGPAGPEEGLVLPAGATLDAEGFLGPGGD